MHARMLLMLMFMGLALPLQAVSQAEKHDRAIFVQPSNAFFDTITARLDRFARKEEPKKAVLRVDFSAMSLPDSGDIVKKYWHNPPISQGMTGTCWCFSTTSFFESEVYRLTKRELKLSEIYTVYWEYVEKARRFVHERGNSEFGEGSEANAVTRIWKEYGVVPESSYPSMPAGQPFPDHRKVMAEMGAYLNSVRSENAWNEDAVIGTIRSILDHHFGRPPEHVEADNRTMTPKEYLRDIVRLNLDDYVDFMSLMEKPYYRQVEYEVPDNWWHNSDYYNVPLDDFMGIIRQAIRKGYTLCLGGDTSEPGYDGHAGVAVVPTFDIPSASIDENAREFRFDNKTTTDDHGIHMVGYLEKDGKGWYLIKDSGAGSRNNRHPGYYYYSDDYVKLKMMDVLVHKSAVEDVLKKFAK